MLMTFRINTNRYILMNSGIEKNSSITMLGDVVTRKLNNCMVNNMKYIKLILSTIFLLCLAPMPYGFYSLIRFVAMIAFAVFAYSYYEKKDNKLAIVFLSLAVLFQPLLPIYLGRVLWNIVDVIVAVFLIILFFKENSHK